MSFLKERFEMIRRGKCEKCKNLDIVMIITYLDENKTYLCFPCIKKMFNNCGYESESKKRKENERIKLQARENEKVKAQAIKEGNENILFTFFDENNIDQRDEFDNTLLFYLINTDRPYLNIIKKVLDKGADPTAICQFNSTPISAAINKGRLDVAKILVNKSLQTKDANECSCFTNFNTNISDQNFLQSLADVLKKGTSRDKEVLGIKDDAKLSFVSNKFSITKVIENSYYSAILGAENQLKIYVDFGYNSE